MSSHTMARKKKQQAAVELPATALMQEDLDDAEDDEIDIEGAAADHHRPDLPEDSCASAVLFKVCICLAVTFPVSVLFVVFKATITMATMEDTGSEVWSPPGSTTVPAVVTAVLICLGIVFAALYGAHRLYSSIAKRRLAVAATARPRPRPKS